MRKPAWGMQEKHKFGSRDADSSSSVERTHGQLRNPAWTNSPMYYHAPCAVYIYYMNASAAAAATGTQNRHETQPSNESRRCYLKKTRTYMLRSMYGSFTASAATGGDGGSGVVSAYLSSQASTSSCSWFLFFSKKSIVCTCTAASTSFSLSTSFICSKKGNIGHIGQIADSHSS